MTPRALNDIRMDKIHFNRYALERHNFLPELQKYSIGTRFNEYSSPEFQSAEIALEAYFPNTLSQKEKWETIHREENLKGIIDHWNKSGASIFTIRDDLIKLFLHTDVNEIPINSINLPYTSIYCYLGDIDPFPDFHPDYRVDGFYLWADGCDIAFWGHRPAPDLDKVRAEAQKDLTRYLHIINNPQLFKEGFAEEQKQWLDKFGGVDHYVEECVKAELDSWEKHERRYQSFLDDPDSFDYGEDWEWYLNLSLDFTVTRKDGTIKSLTPEELAVEPVLRARYDFDTHRGTVGQAIDRLYREGFSPMEHHFEAFDPYVENEISPDDSNWRDERVQLPNGNQKGSLLRLNNYFNVTNRPDLLQDMTRLAFNTLCYLNWKDKDVVLKYPNQKLNIEEANAKSNKAKKQIDYKARTAGYRKLFFCGYKYPYAGLNSQQTETGVAIKSHWRRGHWRNQPFGKGLRDTKLIWIKPVVVAKEPSAPSEPTIYQI